MPGVIPTKRVDRREEPFTKTGVKPIYTANRTIGLLGGSFNPAHAGHLHITLFALHRLHFDEVWWLVSPRNPLKSAESLASYEARLQSAREVAKVDRRIRVLDFERQAGARYSYQTLALLKKRYPAARFVWMMGADNLAQFHRWKRWQQVLASVPVAVFDRAPYSHTALRSKAMIRGRRFLLKTMDIGTARCAPALLFLHLKRSPLSSTEIRKTLGEAGFLRHNKVVGGV